MTRGGKYGTKTPRMRFLHKYTGIIILVIALTIIGIYWSYIELNNVFFEHWGCQDIIQMDHTELIGDEHTRYHEIELECRDRDFTP